MIQHESFLVDAASGVDTPTVSAMVDEMAAIVDAHRHMPCPPEDICRAIEIRVCIRAVEALIAGEPAAGLWIAEFMHLNTGREFAEILDSQPLDDLP